MGFHSPLIGPAISWGGVALGGGTLDSHDFALWNELSSDILISTKNLNGNAIADMT